MLAKKEKRETLKSQQDGETSIGGFMVLGSSSAVRFAEKTWTELI